MAVQQPILHLVCGKIAAGKSTLVTELAQRPHMVAVREDFWLARLYPGEQTSLAEYARNAARLRSAMGPHLVDLLRCGLSVALDFPANTPPTRAWMRGLAEAAGCGHVLHYLDVTDEECRARLRRRNAGGTHEFTVSESDFALFTSHFIPPAAEEGLHVVCYPRPSL